MRAISVLSWICLIPLFVQADEIQGWRTDGSGAYPKEAPPLQWSSEKNVLWATELPPGNAIPIIIDSKVFVCGEPDLLICIDRATGKILWQKKNSYQDLIPRQEQAKVEKELAQAEQFEKQAQQKRRDINQVKKQLKKKEITEAEAEKKIEALESERASLQERINGLELGAKWKLPRAHRAAGYATPTPTTDGKHLWVHYGHGVTACYDLNGNRKWIVLPSKPRDGFGHTSSPVLVGGKLILQMQELIALDAKKGKELWRSKSSHSYGTPTVVKVKDEAMILTAGCELFRASDGKRMARGRNRLAYASPLVVGDKAFFIQQSSRAVEIPGAIDEEEKRAELKSIWFTRMSGKRYFSSPVYHNGLIYTVNNDRQLMTIDAKDGKVIQERELELGKGHVYPTMSLVGKHLLVSSSNGTTVVLETGAKGKVVAINKLEGFRSAPVAHQNKLYFRMDSHLFCIGKK